MTNKLTIHWFKQDLRLQDNPSFYHASHTNSVVPIFIYDNINPKKHQLGKSSKWWLHHSLIALKKSLNGKLYVFSGDPKNILEKLIKKHQIAAIYWNRSYEAWQIARDTKIKQFLKDKNIEVKTSNSFLLWEPWEIATGDNNYYKIFTAFYKKAISDSIISPRAIIKNTTPNIASINENTDINVLKLLENNDWKDKLNQYWNVGEKAALTKFELFCKTGLKNYKEGRNYPAEQNVSKLSPHLHWGEISPHLIWHKLNSKKKDNNIECFLSELGWREFSYHLLYHFPELPEKNFQKKFNSFPWQKNKNYLEKWQKGMTGYPIIDAGMRELSQTGYMHNRVRMIVGSFLVKNLLLHWHYGEKWFWQHLVDADLANNSASWQWVAGSGADAAPYFRIFNPILQGHKFDPQGKYTKKYVPELKNLPDKYLFAPWQTPQNILTKSKITLGKTYPLPVVDITDSRNKALSAYKTLT